MTKSYSSPFVSEDIGEHHPEYPDFLVEILAEYNWGAWRRCPSSGRVNPPKFECRKERTTVCFD